MQTSPLIPPPSQGAAILAQTTAATGGSLTAPGGRLILNTGTATQLLPMSLASFLDKRALERIHTIVFNGATLFLPSSGGNQGPKCGRSCPTETIIKVGMVLKYNDTFVQFTAMLAPTIITVNRGVITITNLPDAPPKLIACGSVKCNTLTVDGIDVNALQAKAKQMGVSRRKDGKEGFFSSAARWMPSMPSMPSLPSCVF